MNAEREPFIFDPNQPEVCEDIERLGKKQVRLLGRASLTRTVEIASFVTLGYAIAEKNTPLMALSALSAAISFVKFGRRRNEIDRSNTTMEKLMDELGTTEDDYLEAKYRDRVENDNPAEA